MEPITASLSLSFVVISKFNSEGKKRTLKSIDKQIKHFDKLKISLEVVIVENGHDSYLESYQFENKIKIKEILGKDKSIYNALNLGEAASTNRYLHFLNAGDELYECLDCNALMNALHEFSKSQKKLLFCAWIVDQRINNIKIPPSKFKTLMLPLPLLSHQAIIYKKTFFENYLDVKTFYASDHLQWLNILRGDDPLCAPLILSNVESGGVSGKNIINSLLQKEIAIQLYKPSLLNLLIGLSCILSAYLAIVFKRTIISIIGPLR